MRDLWNDLAARVRAANRAAGTEAPPGFVENVLRQARRAGRDGSALLDEWVAVLRPAAGLAFGTAVLCLILQYRAPSEVPSDAVTQTETLIQLAVLND